MDQNSINYSNNGASPDDSPFTSIGKAAEEEMLTECELWERQAGDIIIPENVEAQILELAIKHEKRQLNKKRDRFIRRYAKIAAAFVIVISVAFTALLAGADALRGNFFSIYFSGQRCLYEGHSGGSR